MTPASRRYRIRPYRMKTEELADMCRGSTPAEFYSMADSSATIIGVPTLIVRGCWA